MGKKLLKYSLGILSVVADILSIYSFFHAGPSVTSGFDFGNSMFLWSASAVSFLIFILFYLDEFPSKYGISVSFFAYVYYHVVLKRENKFFLISLCFLITTLGLVNLESLQVFGLISLFILGPGIGTYYTSMQDVLPEIYKVLPDLFKDIKLLLKDRDYLYVTDLKPLAFKYGFPRFYLIKIIVKFAAHYPNIATYGFLLNEKSQRSPIRFLINRTKLKPGFRIVL